jgi:hypothetical protein
MVEARLFFEVETSLQALQILEVAKGPLESRWNPAYNAVVSLCSIGKDVSMNQGLGRWKTCVLSCLVLFWCCLALSACFLGAPSGNIITLEKSFKDFRTLTISKGFNVEVKPGKEFKVTIELDDNLEELLQVNQFGKDLSIRLKTTTLINPTLRATIVMPVFEGAELSDASELYAKGFEMKDSNVSITAIGGSTVELEMKAKDAFVQLSGSSSIKGRWEIQNLSAKLTDSSKLDLTGTANNIVLEGVGSIFSLSGLSGKDCKATLTSSAQATVNVTGKLEGTLTEASSLFYLGTPTLGTIQKCEGCTVQAK